MIVVDTLRADYLGCYGHPANLTPRIDEAAASGVRFSNYYSASDFTAAAFASMFTSLYPWQHGVYDFRIKTLPASPYLEALQQRGYERKAIVDFGFFKSYLKQSFDDMEALTDLADNWSVEAPVVEAQRVVQWMSERDASRPFFCFLHVSPPHTPYRFPAAFSEKLMARPDAGAVIERFKATELGAALMPNPVDGCIPADAIERFNRAYLRVNDIAVDEAAREAIRLIYAAEVEVVDALVGHVADALRGSGMLDNTIVSVSADHGEQLWEHDGYGHGISALYNEAIRTPWFVFGGGITRGTVEANVSHTSLLPTLCDWVGLDIPAEAKEKSALALTKDEARSAETRLVFSETKRHIAAIRGRHKLITRNRRRSFSGAPDRLRYLAARARRGMESFEARYELYDLVADPLEQSNVASRRRDVVELLDGAIDAFHASPPSIVDGWGDLTEDEQSRIKKELAGLGYY